MNIIAGLIALVVVLQAGPIYLPVIVISGAPQVTPTPTATPTATSTWTATATTTPTGTATPTATPTRTTSPTSTPTDTATFTPTPTWTATSTPTVTPTATTGVGMLRIAFLQCEGSDEYVRIYNYGGAAVNLAGWDLLSVVGSQNYSFPGYSLQPGTSVYVHSGPDAPPTSGHNLRWTTAYIWNNSGDEARLISPAGVVVDTDDC